MVDTMSLPRFALSIRQPWATLIALGWKDVENRSWRRDNPGIKFRGPFAIHAATGMTRAEYDDCADLCSEIGFTCPAPAVLLRGGIVGVATIVDIVTEMESRWFFGPKGLVIRDARPIDFIPVGGQLGFFDWKKLLPFASNGRPLPVPPAKWMLPEASVSTPPPPLHNQARLL